jgi:hypothetical protein
VPRDWASVTDAVGALSAGQMLLVAASEHWEGVLDISAAGASFFFFFF